MEERLLKMPPNVMHVTSEPSAAGDPSLWSTLGYLSLFLAGNVHKN